MRVLVCGDRNWKDEHFIFRVLIGIHKKTQISLLIEGEARGADTIARIWAEAHNIPVAPYPANWKLHGRAAGPIRNRQMLSAKPDLVVAFHADLTKSKGTADMLRITQKAGVRTLHFTGGEQI